jgi:quinol-cytochrome oxidoreductase complex cytochrome b subunit
MVTPAHIVPEWYFLPFYAILRAITFDIPLWIPGLGLIAFALMLRYPMKARSCSTVCPFGILPILADFLPKKSCSWICIGTLLGLGLICAVTGFAGAVIESKLGGVLAMFGSILILFALPWLDTSPVRSTNYRPVYRWFFWVFVVNAVALGFLGSKPAEGIYTMLSLAGTGYYFAHFLVVLPLLGKIEKTKPLPLSISASVTQPASH